MTGHDSQDASSNHRPLEREPQPEKQETLIWHWRCPNCGQMTFTFDAATPPDMCDYCCDMTTWKRVEDA